jgi:hydroxymethylglutaryl-CoA lyase
MGIATGVDLGALLAVARDAVALPGASPGGRARDALFAAASCGSAKVSAAGASA